MPISMQLCIMQACEITGGMTDSILPRVDEWLLACSDHQEALRYIAPERTMESYRSMVDFLLCETLPLYRKPCRAYYRDQGAPLRELMLPVGVEILELFLAWMSSMRPRPKDKPTILESQTDQ